MEYWGLFLIKVSHNLLSFASHDKVIKLKRKDKKKNEFKDRAVDSLPQVPGNSRGFGCCTYDYYTYTRSELLEPGIHSKLSVEAKYFSYGLLEIMLEG